MKTMKVMIALLCAAKLNYTQAQNLQNGLQACYPLDCNVSNMAATGSILDGTPVNVTCTTGVTGAANSAYAFSGSATSYIQLPNNSLLKPTNAISFSGWVKFNNTSSQIIAFAKNSCSAYFEGYELNAGLVGGNFRLSAVKSSGACSPSTQHIVTGVTNLTTGVWYHVGFYAGTDSLKLILNGVNEGTPIVSTTAFNYANTNVYLGGTNSGIFNQPFSGSMDNVRFYNRKLSPSEFYLLYSTMPACNVSGQPLLTDSLQACYPLDCNATNMAATGSALNGTMFNISCATDRFGTPNAAVAFGNSTTSYIALPNNSKIRPTSKISFSGWVRFNSTTNGQVIVFTKNACTVYFEGYELATTKVGSNMRLIVVKSSAACSPSTQHLITGGTNLAANTWYHVGFYAGTDSIKMYLNGNPEGTPIVSTTAFSYDGTTGVYLGGTNSSILNPPLDGRMDEVRFYNRKVYNSEFYELYNTSPPCSAADPGLLNGLQACYPLNCNAINYAITTSNTPPSLDGTPVNLTCDSGHVNNPNGSYRFAGNSTSYLQLPNDPRIKPTNAISFSCWAKIRVLNSAQYIVFAKNTCGSWFEGYCLTASSVSGQIRYQVVKSSSSSAGCGTQAVLNSTNLYSPYAWHHLAFFIDNSVIKLYVDGVLDNSLSSSVQLNYDNTNVYLGGTNQSFNYPLNGNIDNVRFYNRELTASEIAQINVYDPSCDVIAPCGGNPTNCRPYVATGIKEIKADNKIDVYPNPSSGKLYISNAKDKSVVIYDFNGNVVHHSMTQLDETTAEISLSTYAEGLYFVRVMDANGNSVQTSKIILTH